MSLASYFGFAGEQAEEENKNEHDSRPIIVITGVTGFIGSQLLNHCLNGELAQKYKIRGTVRNPMDAEKMAPLYSWFEGAETFAEKTEIVHLDLIDEASVDEAIKDATYVIHAANPVGINEPSDPNEMIRPSVEGTLNVMRASLKYGVKRVVLTSSVAAIETQSSELADQDPILDETYWSDLDSQERVSSYAKAKTLAEKAAWDFLAQLPEGQQGPELVTILPGLVLGEYICGGTSSSPALIKSIIMNTMPGIPRIAFSSVDIKDVV